MRSGILVSLFFFALLASGTAWARIIAPFGRLDTLSYEQRIARIQPGDTLEFPDGTEVEVARLLAEGTNTRVYELAGKDAGKVLRLPTDSDADVFITRSIEGYEDLRRHGVPTVTVERGLAGKYLIVSRLPQGAMDFNAVYMSRDSALQRRAQAALVDFARRTAAFAHIGDFYESQVYYVPAQNRWILADWTEEHEFFDGEAGSRMVLDGIFGRIPAGGPWDRVRREIRDAVNAERTRLVRAGRCDSLFGSLHRTGGTH